MKKHRLKKARLSRETAPIVAALMHMWSELGTPEEVLEMILSYDGSDLDFTKIETPHGTIKLLKRPNFKPPGAGLEKLQKNICEGYV